ncbi:F0F1 ATP synthase subunit gamma [Aliifodinibius sp. S!AR15-10]|uniref:F0F1 ATP synthase subunit gamma n=1 Tax=Aliifodinibius sp. S!AR15-10 TaxID=2950437 RepID=UPI00285CE8FA|nr:F0F1 ATP synthase subunit gamma [Aliifodinibius sp. S!AR15-10]MDR8393263.1 F0F1 ATP synthase subunit gamma [Aliifodinibius sp. S!AR15-10]
MQRIEAVKRQIKTSQDLLSIVKTMKVLAAVSIHQYEEAAGAVQQYFDTVKMGLQILFKRQRGLLDVALREPERKLVVILFGSGQPMCGQFNEVLASYFTKRLRDGLEDTPSKIVATGYRVAASLQNHGMEVDHIVDVPGSVLAINERVEELVLMLQRWYSGKRYQTIVLFNNKPVSQSSFIPVRHQVLPIDRHWLESLRQRSWPTNQLPTYSMPPEELLSMLLRQYIFVSIYKSFAESLTSEQGSRLNSMQVAEQRIEDHLAMLNRSYHQRRQSEITEEIIDITAGFEALTDQG